MKAFASVLQAVGLAVTTGALAWYSPIVGVLSLGVELVVVGIALERR